MPELMNAAVYKKYGPPEVVSIQQLPRPIINPDQVLIRVHATSVTTGDARLRAWDIPSLAIAIPARFMIGLRKPKKEILGTSVAGVVEEIGSNVDGLSVGQRVLGSTEMNFGGHAEFAATSADGSTQPIPNELSFQDAAALSFGGSAAIYFLKDLGKVQPGHRVLIVGASGALGTSGIQYAKHLGAHVTAVCSGANHELVRSLGADETIDYTKEDFTSRTVEKEQKFDAIYDTVGKTSFRKCKHLMKPNAVFLPAVMTLAEVFQMIWTPLFSKFCVKSGVAFSKPEYIEELLALVEDGSLIPVIDSTYPFSEIVEAHRHIDSGHKRGNVILQLID
jgi:NADPH:quinone reductase-like Zn-dependent oxidoreductase